MSAPKNTADLETCPKCRCAEVSVRYALIDDGEGGDSLRCTCQRCGYCWSRDCADADEKKTK